MAFGLTVLRFVVSCLLILTTSVFLRIVHILPSRRSPAPPRTSPSHLLIVLGSGGHTAEMLSMIRYLSPTRYIYRTYIVSSGDAFSSLKAVEFERTLSARQGEDNIMETLLQQNPGNKEDGAVVRGRGYEILTVPRARRIHQPLYTAPFSSLSCLLACLRFLAPSHPRQTIQYPVRSSGKLATYALTSPDLVLTNGPATGVLVIIAAFILRFLGLGGGEVGGMRCVYVESWARVGGLSLSGRIIAGLGLTERFLVQWEKGLLGGKGREELIMGIDEKVIGKMKGRREWRGFLVE